MGENVFCSLIGKPMTPNADIKDLFKTKKPLGIAVFKFEHAQESLGELINNMDSKVLPPKL